MPDAELKLRQEAGQRVELRMLKFLTNFSPADELKVSDIKSIAMFARTISFDEFTPKQ